MGLIKIINGHFNSVSWINTDAFDFTLSNNVDTWKINVSSNLPLLDDFLSIMRPEEIAGANRFFHTTDKNRSVVTRGAVRTILGKYLIQSPATIEFGVEKNKKPLILNKGKKLHFNISHSGDWILLAVADLEVGADIELVNDAFNYQEVMHDYFSVEEVGYIEQKLPLERFFQLWTRKEALIKATGKGLIDNIEKLPGLDGIHSIESEIISSTDDWLIDSFKLEQQYIASIAYSPAVREVRFFDCNFYNGVNNF